MISRSQTERLARGIGLMLVIMAAILMLSAGTMGYWQGWVFVAVFGIASVVLTFDVARRDPALLERRMRSGPTAEREPRQKAIQTVISVLFFALLVVPGLDRRFGWSDAGPLVVALGDVLVVLCFAGWYFVFLQNSFAASTIEVFEGQKLVDTGLYGLVRHPMYATCLPLFAGIPLALGSYWGLLVALPLLLAMGARLIDEERYLRAHLAGYTDYCAKVRWHLVPGLW